MSDETGTATTTAPVATETPAATETPKQDTPAQPQNAAEYRASMRTQRTRDVVGERPRDEAGRFVPTNAAATAPAETEAPVTTAATEPAKPAAATVPAEERIELPEGHPLRERGKRYFDELSRDELRSIINQPVTRRELEQARTEAAQLRAELARAKAASETWQQQTVSVLQKPEIAAIYSQLVEAAGGDDTIAKEWLRGKQADLEGTVTAKLSEVDAQIQQQTAERETRAFIATAKNAAMARYPEIFLRQPDFEQHLKRALYQYGTDLEFRQNMGEQISYDANGVIEYLDRAYLQHPAVRAAAEQRFNERRQSETTNAAAELERQRLEQAAAASKNNRLGRLPNVGTGQTLPYDDRPKTAAEYRQRLRERIRGTG